MVTRRSVKANRVVKPRRRSISEATKRLVLGEFNHACAICGKHGTQFHHIDEDRTNNEPLNLIPLCPNHHLTEQHHPTRRHDPLKLKLFRKYKHTLILRPQFQAVFKRMLFLYLDQNQATREELLALIHNLTRFLNEFEMGKYFSDQVSKALRIGGTSISNINGQYSKEEWRIMEDELHENARIATIEKIKTGREDVEKIVVEMLDFQKWDAPSDKMPGQSKGADC